MSARQLDINGWIEIEGNPISKVGVFPYSGAQLSPDLIPDKIYMIYRPEEELNNFDCLSSFRLLPWTDEHAMLGSEDEGLLPAENKGIQGVIGEKVYFDSDYLKANLKVFSESMANLIQNGKKELSIGYRAEYDMSTGIYQGVKYDGIQRKIRGNHLALVDSGRSGPDVAVLDHFIFTLDTGLIMTEPMNEEKVVKQEITLESLAQKIDACIAAIQRMHKPGDMDEGSAEVIMEDAEEMESEEAMDTEIMDEEVIDGKSTDNKKKEKSTSAMDQSLKNIQAELSQLKKNNLKAFLSEISERDSLASQLSYQVGTFDHSQMTVDDVAKFGIKELGLKCKSGEETAVLKGFFAGKKNNFVGTAVMDSQQASTIDAYLKEVR